MTIQAESGDEAAELSVDVDEGPLHFAWVLIDRGARGWSWARLRIPQRVVDEHLVGDIHPPNSRPLIAQRIEIEVASDRILDKRGWMTAAELAEKARHA